MVFANMVTGANICIKVSNNKEMVKKQEVTAKNHTVLVILLSRDKKIKIQIDMYYDIELAIKY
jgi:hypothetical protein